MQRLISFILLIVMIFCAPVGAVIDTIQNINDILPSIDSVNMIVFFDMDDTLTDSTVSLGSGAWRKFIRQKIADYESEYGKRWDSVNLHDELTLRVARQIPVKPVESGIPAVITELQNNGISVFVLTARGKSKWYSTDVEDIDLLTHQQLLDAGFDFSLSILPPELQSMDSSFYDEGVIYSSPLKKGALLKKLVEETGYRPSKIVFIDDKMDQVQSMEEAAKDLGIPFVGFWYTRADENHLNFDPIVATLQLMQLLMGEKVMDDQEALLFKERSQLSDPDLFFKLFLDQYYS